MTRAARILLVDDEPAIQKSMAPLIRSRGYKMAGAETGAEALSAIETDPPDLVILDLGLPDIDGIEVCRRIRARSNMPIIVLSARDAERDMITALDEGADDYVTKPFSPDELLARVRVALRRVFADDQPKAGQQTVGDLTIDFDRRRVLRGGEEIRLTPKEFDLLTLFTANENRVLTHRVILKAIWGPHAVNQPEHLWVLVGQLRKKIEADPAHPRYIVSEPWVGYRFVTE